MYVELQYAQKKRGEEEVKSDSHCINPAVRGAGSAPGCTRLKKRNMGDVTSLDVEIQQEETSVLIDCEPEDRPEETANGVKT